MGRCGGSRAYAAGRQGKRVHQTAGPQRRRSPRHLCLWVRRAVGSKSIQSTVSDTCNSLLVTCVCMCRGSRAPGRVAGGQRHLRLAGQHMDAQAGSHGAVRMASSAGVVGARGAAKGGPLPARGKGRRQARAQLACRAAGARLGAWEARAAIRACNAKPRVPRLCGIWASAAALSKCQPRNTRAPATAVQVCGRPPTPFQSFNSQLILSAMLRLLTPQPPQPTPALANTILSPTRLHCRLTG